jgi:hypothetical protein
MNELTNNIKKNNNNKLIEYPSENYKPNDFYFKFRTTCEKYVNDLITILCFPCITYLWLRNTK